MWAIKQLLLFLIVTNSKAENGFNPVKKEKGLRHPNLRSKFKSQYVLDIFKVTHIIKFINWT